MSADGKTPGRRADGCAAVRNGVDHHYGRRIEADRSWTVYHVFTGVPARVDGNAMTGLTRSDATRSMLSLNLGHAACAS